MWRRIAAITLSIGVVYTSLAGAIALAKPFLPLPTPSVAVKAVRKVSLNTATIKELRTLPGVGELLAQRIVAGRPYRAVTDLKRVKGMTPNRYKLIAPRVTL